MLDVGAVLFGFHVDCVAEVPDVGGRMWRMTYEKNGAELVWLERDDDVKTFVIAFKTLPEDDTGVAHILEHSVLAGSEKYPVKSPFDEMRKSSVRVFMNAMTSRDATYYPFSTRNDRDFQNLSDVYLDAVFHPLSMKEPMAFEQEGWHYELKGDKRELSVNGVVFNEMKGVFALPDRRAYREVTSALYPDIVYGHDSGGRPENIPELTYEKYRAFHRRFYHPSNARIFLDGKVDVARTLEKLDKVLGEYDRLEVDARIGSQAPISRTIRLPYELRNLDHKTIFVQGWSAGTITDDVSLVPALDVLVEYLCGSNEAPLKKALLARRLCKDVTMGDFEYRQVPLFLILKDTSEDLLAECRTVVEDTLEHHIAAGFDRARLDAIINRHEFAVREVDSSRPRGLCFFSRVLRQWLYGGDPAAALDATGIYRRLRAGVADGLFERMAHERILKNVHRVELVLAPDADLARARAERTRLSLKNVLDGMTTDRLADVAARVERLKAYQNRVDSKEDVEKIPRLSSRELSKTGLPVDGELKAHGGATCIRTQPTANGISYVTFYFPMEGFGEDELLAMPLFARLHGKLKTSRHSAFELQTLVAANLGRLTYSTVAAERGRYFKVSMAMLEDKAETAFALLREILFETQFDDVREMETILRQKQIDAERDVSGDGRNLCLRVAKRAFSERWAVADILHGEKQLRWLQAARADEKMAARFRALPEKLFARSGLIVSYTGNLPVDVESMVDRMFGGSPGGKGAVPSTEDSASAFSIDGDTGFSAWTAEFPKGMKLTGAMLVAAKILSLEYLHREVREIGGAYGVLLRATASGTFDGYSYRDPSPARTLEAMGKVGGALRRFADSGADIDRYIVSTIAAMDPYRPPADEAARAVELFLDCRAPGDEDRIREEVLATTRSQLLEVADLLDEISPKAKSCIVGGAKQLAGVDPLDVRPVVREAEPPPRSFGE